MSAAADWLDDWLNEQLAAGEKAAPPVGAYNPIVHCRWCNHTQHGLPCGTCKCDSAYTCRDDSWRPTAATGSSVDAQVRRFADLHGVDGWVAMAAHDGTRKLPMTPWRIKQLLNQPTPEGAPDVLTDT